MQYGQRMVSTSSIVTNADGSHGNVPVRPHGASSMGRHAVTDAVI
jgi:hypothetical protein